MLVTLNVLSPPSPFEELIQDLVAHVMWLLPALAVLALLVIGLPLGHRYLLGERSRVGTEQRLPRQLLLLALTLFGLVLLVIALPLETETRGQVLSLAGIAFTAVLTLASTTFVANAMAGLMLRSIRSFRPGDYIRVVETFGRVTERGLFHVEIQSEDRDLVTLPNLTLVTNPVKVIKASGTVVSVHLSLGYDAPRERVRRALLDAAEDIGLGDAFVHVKELGDFAVTYMVAGFLDDIDRLLTTRSKLRIAVLDHLHREHIEIVSPTFMNQRVLDPERAVLPHGDHVDLHRAHEEEPLAEEVAFEKAARAGELEELRDEREELVAVLAKGAEGAPSDEERPRLEGRLAELESRIDDLEAGLDGA